MSDIQLVRDVTMTPVVSGFGETVKTLSEMALRGGAAYASYRLTEGSSKPKRYIAAGAGFLFPLPTLLVLTLTAD